MNVDEYLSYLTDLKDTVSPLEEESNYIEDSIIGIEHWINVINSPSTEERGYKSDYYSDWKYL